MERKHKTPRGSTKHNEHEAAPETVNPHIKGSQQTSEDTGTVILQRPWATRPTALSDSLRKEHWGKEKSSNEKGALEYWKIQPMIDGPYQNVHSVVSKTQTPTDKFSDTKQTPTQAAPRSETAATSGSAR
ncbi:hypothetical protein GGS26DRAFT_586819 [Hypomontagnella submonticulosa]|nr:hypothetical protein GGS26DRAFT_586819 [Hypomontagnella submonticulosa]